MKARLGGLLAVGLILVSAACGGEGETWVPVCQDLPPAEAEHIITAHGRGRVAGDIAVAVALRGEETYDGRAVWAVILRVGATRLILLHETSASVESPGDPGWRDGRWLSYSRMTGRVLRFPLNGSRSEPYPSAVVEVAEGCDLSRQGF